VPSLDTLFARSIPTVSLAVGGEQVDAVITEVMDDCTFHIQADIAKSQLKLNEILGAVHQYCSTNTIPYKPVKGEMVCTQFRSWELIIYAYVIYSKQFDFVISVY
jgi:hypothetical protein